MTPLKTCVSCGASEVRKVNEIGALISTSINPITGRCVGCTVTEAASTHTFHSRREDRLGQVFDARAAAARNDE
jgi:hypothetical protein